MAEVKKPARVFQVEMQCEKPTDDVSLCPGTMVADGTAYLTNPPKYQHICNHCGTKATYRIKYPTIRYEVI